MLEINTYGFTVTFAILVLVVLRSILKQQNKKMY